MMLYLLCMELWLGIVDNGLVRHTAHGQLRASWLREMCWDPRALKVALNIVGPLGLTGWTTVVAFNRCWWLAIRFRRCTDQAHTPAAPWTGTVEASHAYGPYH